MHLIADICVIPLGVGLSVSEYVAACERVFEDAGLERQLHAYGTNVEGELDTILRAVQTVHETLHAEGAPRLVTSIKLGTRIDKEPSLAAKLFKT